VTFHVRCKHGSYRSAGARARGGPTANASSSEYVYLAVAALNQGPVVTPVATTTLLSTTARNNTLGSNCGTCSSAVKSAARVAGPS